MLLLDPRMWLAFLVAFLCGVVPAWFGGKAEGRKEIQAQWDAAERQRLEQVNQLVAQRTQEIQQEYDRQKVKNEEIEKTYTEEITRVRRLLASRRMRGTLTTSAAAMPAGTESTHIRFKANSGSWLADRQPDEDTLAVILTAEKGLATGRACQAFLRANELN